MELKIHHIGYLVKNIEKARDVFISLGYKTTKNIFKDDHRLIKLCFIEKDGYLIELISPISKESIVYNLLHKIGNNPYHICYVTNNLEETINDLREKNFTICNELYSAIAFNNKRVVFMINSKIGMIELLEE